MKSLSLTSLRLSARTLFDSFEHVAGNYDFVIDITGPLTA